MLDVNEVELPTFQASLDGPNRISEQAAHPHRTFLHARIDGHGTPVNLISIRFIAGRPATNSAAGQLEWGRYLLAAHHQEVRFFLDYLAKVKGPIVFGGDLNAPPSAMLIRHLEEVASDAYLSTHTFGRPTFRVNLPTLRLDYLFSMNGAVALDADRPDRIVSDHFPLLASFALPSP